MSDGLLGRWSKRKLEVKAGKAVEAEPVAANVPPPPPPPRKNAGVFSGAPEASPGGGGSEDPAGRGSEGPASRGSEGPAAEQPVAVVAGAEPDVPPPPPGEGRGGGNESEVPPPTLDDVKALTAESDFSRFAAPNVAPEVKNAAMKKLFTDPRYNVMDGLDIYTGDYSQPDPIPESMIRQLASVKFLGLFAREEKEEAQAEAARQARDVANNPTAQSVAQSEAAPPAVPEPPDHADPDLRLQQDHAAEGEDPGRGAG